MMTVVYFTTQGTLLLVAGGATTLSAPDNSVGTAVGVGIWVAGILLILTGLWHLP